MCDKETKVVALDLDEPRYDQDTFWGRAKHHFQNRNPFNVFTSSSRIVESRCLYLKYKCGGPLPDNISEEDLWTAKATYDSAYNPETGELISTMARPSGQVWANMVLAGGMMAHYKSTLGVILWQWLNQTYNAFVSYANRGDLTLTDTQLMTSYTLSTSTALGTALGLNHMFRCSPSLAARFVPLAAVAAAHVVNVPLMRAQMLKNGVPIYDECHVKLGYSKMAAQAGINGGIFDRLMNAVPPMALTPIFMHYLEGRGTLCRYPWLNFPLHTAIAGLCLVAVSPLTCALLNRRALLSFKHLEPELKEHLCKKFYDRPPKYVYYNRP